jgi:pyrroline-5-carboxylate reductase
MPAASSKPRDDSPRWGFLGAGQMAVALAGGLVRAGVASPGQIVASDPYPAARERFTSLTGAPVLESNTEVVARSDVLVLAVKPQTMPALLAEVGPHVDGRHLVVSIAAGITSASLRAGLPAATRLIRVMSNTPALVSAGASAYCLGPGATAADEALVRACLDAVGRCQQVPESLLDAVTGLSGSGPAYVFLMIEALADGGVRAGLPRDTAQMLAAQTVLGAARMVLESGEHPGVLKDRVASPGGTTITGLHALERAGVRGAFIDAVLDATRRSIELGEPNTAR